MSSPGHAKVVLASAARTATHNVKLTNMGNPGILITTHVTVYTAGSLTLEILVPNAAGAYTAHQYWAAAAAIAATGAFEYLLYPGTPAGGNLTEVDGVPCPAEFAINFAHGDATAITYDCVVQFLA